MDLIHNLQQRFFKQFLDKRQNTFSTSVFCKALVGFTVIKIMLIWKVSIAISGLHEFIPSTSPLIRILFFSAFWASKHLLVFYILSLIVLIAILIFRWSYLSGVLFFWVTLNLFRINVSINNGADYVLLMLSFWSIGMSLWPVSKDASWNTLLNLFFNVSVFLCQLQIVFIYFASGWDKLISEVWRSGDAISYVTHLDFMFNRYWFRLPDNHFLNLILSWMTILFEVSFGVFVWIKSSRLIMLVLGVVFHLVIWFSLSLPDFGLIMMISYLIFLKDIDYKIIGNWLKLKLP